jgi:beta-galactosidase/beta-glucuronidase
VLSINTTVPGDLVSDLQAAGWIGDPLFSTNFRNSTFWHGQIWTYRTTFDAASMLSSLSPASRGSSSPNEDVVLVMDGVKLGARVSLNGHVLGEASDQFVRYTWSVGALLNHQGPNQLAVEFDESISCDGRYMACSGGWDWAPYTTAKDSQGLAVLSKGIWKDVYLVQIVQAAITHVVPQVIYNGAYPTTRLTDGDAPFLVKVEVHVTAANSTAASGSTTIRVSGSWGLTNSTVVTLPPGDSVVELWLTADKVNLWWPNGAGEQHLYTVTAEVLTDGGRWEAGEEVWRAGGGGGGKGGGGAAVVAMTTRQVGFRSIAFVTEDDSDPAKVAAKGEGTGSFTMRFKVNGVNLYVRGANMIPMEVLEGRASAEALGRLVHSAAIAHFNILRVWGGGIFQYRAFYDACDQYGILLFHDMQYAQLGHVPHATPRETEELTHQTRRLSNHPSIAIYDGCNECVSQGHDIWDEFVMTTVARARCAFSDRNLRSRMPLDPTHVRLKLLRASNQWHFS